MWAMSELKMIVDQAIEEMGGWNDEAIDRWSELAGVDIRSIDENTPFDIDIANKLLATFPQVVQEMKSKGEPSPDEVINDLSEIAESLGEALGMDQEAQEPVSQQPQETVPEVDLETGVPSEEGFETTPVEPIEPVETTDTSLEPPQEQPPTPAEPEAQPAGTTADSGSIDELMKELESLASEVNVMSEEEGGVEAGPPGFKEEVSEEPAQEVAEATQPQELPSQEPVSAEAELPEPTTQETKAEEAPLAEASTGPELPSQPEISEGPVFQDQTPEPSEQPAPEEAEQPTEGVPVFPEETLTEAHVSETTEQELAPEPVAEETVAEPPEPETAETPAEEPAAEAVSEEPPQPIEIPQPIAQELEAATRIMDEMESPEFNLGVLEKGVPGFQAACVIKDDKVVAKHGLRQINWAELINAISATNSVFSGALDINERAWEELVIGLGNLFIIGFGHKGAQIIVVVKSERLGAARAWVSAALKKL